MKCVDFRPTKTIGQNNQKHIVAEIYSDDVPAVFPTTGVDIDNLNENYILEVGSTIYVVNTGQLYMKGETDEWVEQ